MPRKTPLRDRIDKATLEKLYHGHGLSTVQIAERLGSHSANVLALMKEYGIARRTRGAGKSASRS
jgi:transcriptional regulator of aromatic amino acid metabolism